MDFLKFTLYKLTSYHNSNQQYVYIYIYIYIYTESLNTQRVYFLVL